MFTARYGLNLYITEIKSQPNVTSLSPRRAEFHPWSMHVRFVVDKVTLELVFLPALGLSPSASYRQVSFLHLHLVLSSRTNGRSLGTFHKAVLFRKSRSIGLGRKVPVFQYLKDYIKRLNFCLLKHDAVRRGVYTPEFSK